MSAPSSLSIFSHVLSVYHLNTTNGSVPTVVQYGGAVRTGDIVIASGFRSAYIINLEHLSHSTMTYYVPAEDSHVLIRCRGTRDFVFSGDAPDVVELKPSKRGLVDDIITR